jgi:ABC-type dipeptide/oligopeptide/nickel transport system permease subunit
MKKQNFFLKNKTFTIFGILAILIILAAIFAPIVSGGVDPTEGDLSQAIQPPGPGHIFGTDKMGRDIYARVIYGARTSLTASFSIVLIVFAVGLILGIIAGYFGGAVDVIIMRLADMMIAFPGLVLAWR